VEIDNKNNEQIAILYVCIKKHYLFLIRGQRYNSFLNKSLPAKISHSFVYKKQAQF
jgi:hypothetical protein